MALSKKKSRAIRVDDIQYRWQFFENSGWNDVTVQNAEGNGAKLVVQFLWEHQGTPHISLLPPVTSKQVSAIIEEAIELGWKPLLPGKPWRMRWGDGALMTV